MTYSHQAPHTMTLQRSRRTRAGALAMPRRRGASAGTLLVLLGIWGGIIPFIGPVFSYRMDASASWTFTWDRLWLNILPGAAAFLGGLILLGVANRLSATVGCWLAMAGGIWFVVGPTVSLLWNSPIGTNGVGLGSNTQRFIEQIGFFYGLGAVITALSAGALARVLVRTERDTALLESAAAADAATETETARASETATATETETATYPEGPYPDRPVTAGEPYREGEGTVRPAPPENDPGATRPGRLSWPEDEDDPGRAR